MRARGRMHGRRRPEWRRHRTLFAALELVRWCLVAASEALPMRGVQSMPAIHARRHTQRWVSGRGWLADALTPSVPTHWACEEASCLRQSAGTSSLHAHAYVYSRSAMRSASLYSPEAAHAGCRGRPRQMHRVCRACRVGVLRRAGLLEADAGEDAVPSPDRQGARLTARGGCSGRIRRNSTGDALGRG